MSSLHGTGSAKGKGKEAADDGGGGGSGAQLDGDFLCPICMEVMKDAFLALCGHSFCYMCIVTHLRDKSDCPSCGRCLTVKCLYPNFPLDRLLKKTSVWQMPKNGSPVEHLHRAVHKGFKISLKELDNLLSALQEQKKKLEQKESDTSIQILLNVLYCLRSQKIRDLQQVQTDLEYIKEDMNAVERYRIELYRAKKRNSIRFVSHLQCQMPTKLSPSIHAHSGSLISSHPASTSVTSSGNVQKNVELEFQGSSKKNHETSAVGCSNPENFISQSGLAVAKKKRIHMQFNNLQECYLHKRRQGGNKLGKLDESEATVSRKGYHADLEDFQSVLTTFTQYSRLKVIAEIGHEEFSQSANIVSSIDFDREDEFFATAGVCRRIKVFDFTSVVNGSADERLPIVEIPCQSKLSCLSWNKYTKNHIASSDFEGIVTIWDINTQHSIIEYEEHEKRVWSVDFSCTEPSMLASGSDDYKLTDTEWAVQHEVDLTFSLCDETDTRGWVKIWCMKQEASVIKIDLKANICCVKYNPRSGVHLAVGSADHNVHYYDLRNTKAPLHVFNGHTKAVSYVKFLSTNELVSASIDSTLQLWDVKAQIHVQIFRGHTNERNFVGLTVNNEYIACGGETNEVFVYHKAISNPSTTYRFDCTTQDDTEENVVSDFISAVCWKNNSSTLLTGNSQGTMKVLVLAA